jgi:signal transduction histidine kinase
MLVDDIAETKEESEMAILRDQLKITTAILGEIFDELIESLQVKYDVEIKSKIINLTDYLNKTCDSLRGQINRSKAVIEFDFDESPLILFPPKYVHSILHNLISNSLKYQSPQRKPLIRVKTKREGDKVLLSVSDNGLGIDLKKHHMDLFKIRRVFHAHPDAKGFGLFITKCQIEAMNGRIWAESMPGVGSTFNVEFSNQDL